MASADDQTVAYARRQGSTYEIVCLKTDTVPLMALTYWGISGASYDAWFMEPIARNNWIWWIVTFLPVTEERNNGTSNSILTGWTQLHYSYRKSVPGTYQLMKPKYQTEDGIPLSVFMMDCPHGTIDFYARLSSIDRNRLVTLGLTIKFIGGCCW